MINIGNLKIMMAFYNGFCLGLRTETMYDAETFIESLENEEIKGINTWILVLPFLEIRIFFE